MAKCGRKSLQAEVDANKLFELSYYTLLRAMNSKNVTEAKKLEIALAIYTKHLPNKIEHSGQIAFTQQEKDAAISRISALLGQSN